MLIKVCTLFELGCIFDFLVHISINTSYLYSILVTRISLLNFSNQQF